MKLKHIIAVTLIAVTATLIPVVPLGDRQDANAAYNHIPACLASLRGVRSDNDVHNFGQSIGATNFIGWAIRKNGTYGRHARDGSVYVRGVFGFANGGFQVHRARCWGGDFHGDKFYLR